jgi:glycyl-tRNA synthetase beta chain
MLEAQPADQSYTALSEALSAINPAVELFFEKVMVNDPDDAVRKNRYNLLSVLNRFYLKLACFTKLVV